MKSRENLGKWSLTIREHFPKVCRLFVRFRAPYGTQHVNFSISWVVLFIAPPVCVILRVCTHAYVCVHMRVQCVARK